MTFEAATMPRRNYIAEIHQAREVTLRGCADLDFWSARLAEHQLRPIELDGFAEVVFTTAEAKWKGVRFTELSISVAARADWNGNAPKGMLLVHAFNSSRLFTFCERRMLGTPYYHANVTHSVELPVSIYASGGSQLLSLTMRSGPREHVEIKDDSWAGPIFLPKQRKTPHRLFWARLEGRTETFAFEEGDTIEFGSEPRYPILKWLDESNFNGRTWTVRKSASHARTKTERVAVTEPVSKS